MVSVVWDSRERGFGRLLSWGDWTDFQAFEASSYDGGDPFDWGGGLIWLAIEARPDGAHQEVRDALAEFGGHATLLRAAADVRSQVPVFQPQAEALARISARVKNSFDPKGVLCPGRMV